MADIINEENLISLDLLDENTENNLADRYPELNHLINIYPFNLIHDILGSSFRGIYMPGLFEAVSMLTKREVDILYQRYAEGKSLDQCSKIHNLSRERIRQIQAKSLRRLRHPSRSDLFIAIPREEVKKIENEYEKLKKDYNLLSEKYKAIT